MERISVEVILMANSSRYEFLLPIAMEVKVAKQLMTKVISGMEGVMLNRESLVLYAMKKGCEVELNVPIEQSCMKDGSQLMLI